MILACITMHAAIELAGRILMGPYWRLVTGLRKRCRRNQHRSKAGRMFIQSTKCLRGEVTGSDRSKIEHGCSALARANIY